MKTKLSLYSPASAPTHGKTLWVRAWVVNENKSEYHYASKVYVLTTLTELIKNKINYDFSQQLIQI